MKSIIYKISIVLAFISVFTSCEEEDVNVYSGESIVSFVSTPQTVQVREGEDNSIIINLGVTTTTDFDRSFTVTVDPSSTATPDQYTITSDFIIPANEFIGTIIVTPNFDSVLTTGSTLVLNIDSAEDAIIGLTETYSLNLFKFCPSDLNVSFDWVATQFSYQGSAIGGTISGSDALVRVDGSDTRFVYESGFFDFGYYCTIYNGASPGCGDGAAGSLQLDDTCGKLSYVGADQFGDGWTISNVVVEGSDLTFTWESDFGESSRVTLTRTDGEEWPELF